MEGVKKTLLSKICHTYPTLMKLSTVIPFVKKIQKNTYITWHAPWFLLILAFFHRKSAIFSISANTGIDCILMHKFYRSFKFFESLKVVLVNMIEFLMMSAKLATWGLLKIMVFWNKGYDIIASVCDITNKILSCNQSLETLVFLREKLS